MGTRIWKVGANLKRLELLSLAVGSVVRDALARHSQTPDMIKTKWPNDVYVGLSKICGILIEAHKGVDGLYWAAIGIGINLAHAPETTDGRKAAHFSWSNDAPPPETVLGWLEEGLGSLLQSWPPSSPQTFIAGWEQNAFGLHETVVISNGSKGCFVGLADNGAARVALDSGRETIVHAGDLTFESLEKARNAPGD